MSLVRSQSWPYSEHQILYISISEVTIEENQPIENAPTSYPMAKGTMFGITTSGCPSRAAFSGLVEGIGVPETCFAQTPEKMIDPPLSLDSIVLP